MWYIMLLVFSGYRYQPTLAYTPFPTEEACKTQAAHDMRYPEMPPPGSPDMPTRGWRCIYSP